MLTQRIKALSRGHLLTIVFLVALALRLAFLTTKPFAWTHQLQAGDEPLYHGVAASLTQGKGYTLNGEPTARYGPGYVIFIAALYRLLGISPPAARVGNALLGSLLCALIAWWAIQLWGNRAGLGAGLAATVYYPFVQLPPYLLTENLYLPLFVAAMMVTWLLCADRARNEPVVKGALAGTLWGVAALTRSIALPIALLSSLWLGFRRQWMHALLAITSLIAVLTPWTLRNYSVFAAFVPLQLSAGHDFYLAFGPPGTEPKVLGHWNWGSDVQRPQIPKGLSPVERDRWLQRKAWEHIKSDPMSAIIKRIPRKLANLLVPFYGPASLPNKVLSTLCYLALLLLSIPALVRSWRSKDAKERTFTELVLLVILFTVTFHAIFYGVVRYRYPIDALLLVAVGKWMAKC
ncbi:hypothetical protein HRbin17_01325 [bacterium HR17]|uniref:Glycosyltransferase RgtA/B/C/D-like domain-containing protein n=1 Tax=Candidatus Fervidibacter japonicus TaxID=2035412 RepID=A0A2H5XC85_9BACT|nr:hypothetical protein HRbin17_01325 [bacterium HR17]